MSYEEVRDNFLVIGRKRRDTDESRTNSKGRKITGKKGLGKLILNKAAIDRDLDNNWAVVAEGIQTILRREGYPNPYEALKALTRTNESVTHESICKFIDGLEISESVKEELRNITPHNYIGK